MKQQSRHQVTVSSVCSFSIIGYLFPIPICQIAAEGNIGRKHGHHVPSSLHLNICVQDEGAEEGDITDFLQLALFKMKLPCVEKSSPDTEKPFLLEMSLGPFRVLLANENHYQRISDKELD